MSTRPRAGVAGSVVYTFENLCIQLERGEKRVFGEVSIAFDGAGAYWPVAMKLFGSTPDAPVMWVKYGVGLWREIMRSVEKYHAEDVARLINEELEKRGLHMAIFDEHAPARDRRPMPPHVRPSTREAPMVARDRPTDPRERLFVAKAIAAALAAAGLVASAFVPEKAHPRPALRAVPVQAGPRR